MKSSQPVLSRLIETVLGACTSGLLRGGDGKVRFIDPVDKVEISAHYGATHMAASLLLLGKLRNDNALECKGRDLLKSILDRWAQEHTLPDYHFDFNNFAFVICYDCLDSGDDLRELIKKVLLESPDSAHDTVNWLPMRLYVNRKRFELTGDRKYSVKIEYCRNLIAEATNGDGGIEDRLPKGVSYNLQYNISSLATICFDGADYPDYDIAEGIRFLLRCIAPDGDINYQGRGCNQIFAWGPWIYILASNGLSEQLETALEYIDTRVTAMLDNHNMFLNNWPGEERYLWWDYHYASVYTAHLLMWLSLSLRDFGKHRIKFTPDGNDRADSATGIDVFKSDTYFVTRFRGRNEYLAEYGPSINLIWTRKDGIVVKGSFGPWRGSFGNRHSFEDVALMNYCGPVGVDRKVPNGFLSRIGHRLRPLSKSKIELKKFPVFCSVDVSADATGLKLTWETEKPLRGYFNFPTPCSPENIGLIADGVPQRLTPVAKIKNQYGWIDVLQSHHLTARVWELIIPL